VKEGPRTSTEVTRTLRSGLYKAIERITSPRTKHYYEEAHFVESCGRSALAQFQLHKLNRLLDRLCDLPFYRTLLRESDIDRPLNSIDELTRLPIMTKDMITAHLQEQAESPHAWRRYSTSGSTGRNFCFYHNREKHAASRAALRRGREWIGIDHYADPKAIIWGLSPSMGVVRHWKQSLLRWVSSTTMLQAYALDDEMCLAHWDSIKRIRPVLIEGYPNYLLALARAGNRAGITPYTPRAVVTSGETLFEETRAEIEDYFRAPVHNRYGSREFSAVAHQCRTRDALHIHAHRHIVETDVDGELLITDLDNVATPFVRYRVGDAGVVDWVDCACGRKLPSIVQLQGRAHDVIRTPSGRQLPGQFWTTLSRTVQGIDQLQVVQHPDGVIELRVRPGALWKDEFAERLKARVASTVPEPIEFRVTTVARLETTAAGKRRFIINLTEGAHANP